MQKEIKKLLDKHNAILDCDGFRYYMRTCDNKIMVTELYNLCNYGDFDVSEIFNKTCEQIVNNGGR